MLMYEGPACSDDSNAGQGKSAGSLRGARCTVDLYPPAEVIVANWRSIVSATQISNNQVAQSFVPVCHSESGDL